MTATIDTAPLYGDSTFSDVTIKYGKGKEFKGHKLVLAGAIDKLKEMLKDPGVKIVTLDAEDDEDAVELMLRYIYTSAESDPSLCTRLQLSLLTDKYGIDGIDVVNEDQSANELPFITDPNDILKCIQRMPVFLPQRSDIARQLRDWFDELVGYEADAPSEYKYPFTAFTVEGLLESDDLGFRHKFFHEILLRAERQGRLAAAGLGFDDAFNEIRKRTQNCEKCKGCVGDVAFEALMGRGWAESLSPGDKVTDRFEPLGDEIVDKVRKRLHNCEYCKSIAENVAYEAFTGTGWVSPIPEEANRL
ncbi:hypothetical protein EJ03DRAFT_10122 [Teratosphaeria nubilosa]|uniref:BTB domain-containing protein n=1 Tax=Teratosphaeria nubilosa TaxID=161662 RepID=A0A6G1LHE6_9PEZI|nr:hypothetical protein EJ03DRAFT_10122 [Teratosphaeria nubilosa]